MTRSFNIISLVILSSVSLNAYGNKHKKQLQGERCFKAYVSYKKKKAPNDSPDPDSKKVTGLFVIRFAKKLDCASWKFTESDETELKEIMHTNSKADLPKISSLIIRAIRKGAVCKKDGPLFCKKGTLTDKNIQKMSHGTIKNLASLYKAILKDPLTDAANVSTFSLFRFGPDPGGCNS